MTLMLVSESAYVSGCEIVAATVLHGFELPPSAAATAIPVRRCSLALMATTLLLCVVSCQASTSPPASNHATVVDRYLAAQAKDQHFSGTVLIAQAGKILLAKAYGWADEEQRLPNRLTTRFGIGSISKQFTAMAILLLQQRGKLHVDDPVCHYISGCPAAWYSITIKNLLTHTSGIPDYYAASLSAQPRLTSASLLAYLEQQQLDFPPGSQFRYSNSGYAILGFVIQDLSGESYQRFLQDALFDPLHLASSGDLENPPSVPNLAVGYDHAWIKAGPVDASPLLGAGSLYSAVQDLYTWDTALFNRTFATPSLLGQMFAPQVTACNSAGVLCTSADCAAQVINCFSYGYGWFLQQLPVKNGYVRAIWHNGLVPGFASLNYYYPDQKLTVILLSNLASVSTSSNSIADIVDLTFF
jgi:CubicO group peptidase (beta-lactamase class C family)